MWSWHLICKHSCEGSKTDGWKLDGCWFTGSALDDEGKDIQIVPLFLSPKHALFISVSGMYRVPVRELKRRANKKY